jgi:hypothetical protein
MPLEHRKFLCVKARCLLAALDHSGAAETLNRVRTIADNLEPDVRRELCKQNIKLRNPRGLNKIVLWTSKLARGLFG